MSSIHALRYPCVLYIDVREIFCLGRQNTILKPNEILDQIFRCVHASLYEALSVRRSVRRSRVSQISRKSRLWDNKTSGNNEFKLIQLNSSKFKKIQENSFILTYVGRIFVRIELVHSDFHDLSNRYFCLASCLPIFFLFHVLSPHFFCLKSQLPIFFCLASCLPIFFLSHVLSSHFFLSRVSTPHFFFSCLVSPFFFCLASHLPIFFLLRLVSPFFLSRPVFRFFVLVAGTGFREPGDWTPGTGEPEPVVQKTLNHESPTQDKKKWGDKT